MDRGAWQATVHRVLKSKTPLNDQCFHFFSTFLMFSTRHWILLSLVLLCLSFPSYKMGILITALPAWSYVGLVKSFVQVFEKQKKPTFGQPNI